MTARVKVRPRLSQGLGLDQLFIAKLVQVTLERQGIPVDFQLVPRGIAGADFIGMFNLEFGTEEDTELAELRSLLESLDIQHIWEGSGFKELRVGSTSEIRRTLEREVAGLEVLYRPAADEWETTANYGGPACAAFEQKAAEVLGYVEDTIRRRLRPALKLVA